jgi:hypothetical protein
MMCFFILMCLLCALVVSIAFASNVAVFAFAVVAFLILSIVSAIFLEAENFGLEPPHPLPLPAAVPGSQRRWQPCCAAFLDVRDLVRIIIIVVVIWKQVGLPDYCTVLVQHCWHPPPHRCSSCAAAAAVVIILMLPEHAIVVVVIFVLVLLFFPIVKNPTPLSVQQRHDGNATAKGATIMTMATKHPIGALLQILFLLTMYNVFIDHHHTLRTPPECHAK